MRDKYLEVINREPQKRITRYAAGIMGGTGFAVFFGCNVWDAIVALIVSVMIVAVGDWLAKRESNLMVYNAILSFISEVIIIVALKMGVADHPDRIMIEYNGMYQIEDVMDVIDETDLELYQIIVTVDASTADLYLKNMRSHPGYLFHV